MSLPRLLLGKLKLALQLLDMCFFRPQASSQLAYLILLLINPHQRLLQLGLYVLQASERFTPPKELPIQGNSSSLHKQHANCLVIILGAA